MLTSIGSSVTTGGARSGTTHRARKEKMRQSKNKKNRPIIASKISKATERTDQQVPPLKNTWTKRNEEGTRVGWGRQVSLTDPGCARSNMTSFRPLTVLSAPFGYKYVFAPFDTLSAHSTASAVSILPKYILRSTKPKNIENKILG